MNDFSVLPIITARDNSLIKQYIKLRDMKKVRKELGMFVIEGARLVLDAAAEGIIIEAGFLTEEAARKYPEAAAELVRTASKKVYMISDAVSDRLSDTGTSQGIYCLAHTLDKILTADKINKYGRYLILNNLQDPGNVGTIIRVADAVGLDGVYLCGCCDIYNPKTVRSTMGSMFRVPISDELNYQDAVKSLSEAGVTTYASVIDKDALDVRGAGLGKGCAVVIGNEGNGLTHEESDICDKRITIRMQGNINSLNAASAACILLWEMSE